MRSFELVRASDARHAVSLLADHGTGAMILAGGTELLINIRAGLHRPRVLVDICRVRELKGIELNAEGLRIGALVTHTELLDCALVREHAPVLADAVRTLGTPQTRNLGTLGGNLAACVPCMDSGPALCCLDAVLNIVGPRGNRCIAVSELFLGPRRNTLDYDEVLVDIVIPRSNLGKPAAFFKAGLRKGQALALTNVATSLHVSIGERPGFASPMIALGAVGPTVLRAVEAEAFLAGRPISPGAIAIAGRIAASEARPISDFRATAEYRRRLVGTLVTRALARSCERAGVSCAAPDA